MGVAEGTGSVVPGSWLPAPAGVTGVGVSGVAVGKDVGSSGGTAAIALGGMTGVDGGSVALAHAIPAAPTRNTVAMERKPLANLLSIIGQEGMPEFCDTFNFTPLNPTGSVPPRTVCSPGTAGAAMHPRRPGHFPGCARGGTWWVWPSLPAGRR